MCGIAGILDRRTFDPALLVGMTDLIHYRGPDGFGYAFFELQNAPQCFHNQPAVCSLKPSVGLGTRRLAILDTSAAGNQPMSIENGKFWITYNGEIYNYLEIAEELKSLGRSFHTGTDTEVILNAYAEWGANCVRKFNGMWAFAIWDTDKRSLFCSRDRFGIKPFYYLASAHSLLFSSEIKQLLIDPEVPRATFDQAILEYLTRGLVDYSDRTFFEHIRQLSPGHNLTARFTETGIEFRIEKFWDLQIDSIPRLSDTDAAEKFDFLFRRAVRWQMRSDVPVGSCLSGGLDSSSIVSVASKLTDPHNFFAFSAAFDDPAFDERHFISAVVKATGIRSQIVMPEAEGFWDDLKCLIWHQDEPVGGTSIYAQWCVMRAARAASIPVLLDGQGGDETLCGYRKFYLFYLWQLFTHANPRVLPESLAWLYNADLASWKWSQAKRYSPLAGVSENSLLHRTTTDDFRAHTKSLPKAEIGSGGNLRQRQRADLLRFSVPALLRYEDRNSMAHSIEARVPMLDHELAEFAVNCAPDLKLRNGWTKWILRKTMCGTLTEVVRKRKTKLGFSTPQQKWIAGDRRGLMHHLIQQPQLQLHRILAVDKMAREIQSFLDGDPDSLTDMEIFRIMNLELWAQAFNVS
jgi:asparagine synthase (glutamine-hydrolysing)